jgi:hypothetical protein
MVMMPRMPKAFVTAAILLKVSTVRATNDESLFSET